MNIELRVQWHIHFTCNVNTVLTVPRASHLTYSVQYNIIYLYDRELHYNLHYNTGTTQILGELIFYRSLFIQRHVQFHLSLPY